MKTKIEIKTERGKVLFEYEKENNTIKDTVEEAVRNGVSLEKADFIGVDLSGADLSGANLSGANLCEADLSGANLTHASFKYANLICAGFYGSNLYYADFSKADLSCADLKYANLSGANIYGASLYGVDLGDAKNIPYIPMNIPEGEFIGWKKLSNGIIVKLKILADSKRSRATSDKCRCDKALVLEFQNKDGSKTDITEYTNNEYTECTYRVGEIVYADAWDENRWNECSHGIHFFLDRQTAVNY